MQNRLNTIHIIPIKLHTNVIISALSSTVLYADVSITQILAISTTITQEFGTH